MRVIVAIGLSVLLSGCPLDADDGKNGVQGLQGAQGEQGPQGDPGAMGLAGINCWDINENRQADLSTEDVNGDGVVNVQDCRDPALIPHVAAVITQPEHLDPNHPDSLIQHTSARRHFATFDNSNYLRLLDATDSLLHPIDDGCGLWDWYTDDAGFVFIHAKDSYNYRTEFYNYMTREPDPNDPNVSIPHPGYEHCLSACKEDKNCIGAYYNAVKDTGNSLVCKMLTKYTSPQPEAFQFNAIGAHPNFQHQVAVVMQSLFLDQGIFSVCN